MTENHHKRLQYLFQQYLNDQISEKEYAEFWELLHQVSGKDELSAELQELWENAFNNQPTIPKKQWDKKMRTLISATEIPDNKIKLQKGHRKFYTWTAAAILFLVIGGSFYFLKDNDLQKAAAVPSTSKHKTLVPGGNKAVLTLANGSSIILDNAANGTLSKQGKALVTKSDNGKISYSPANGSLKDVVYNTLRTPRGGKYQITLADNTKVWLNSASSLRFPTSFPGNKRIVEVTGEAYFEVAENAAKPFIVAVNGMEIKVLGTHFNVKAYDDESVMKTTLLEGAVVVKKEAESVLLSPGEQASVDKAGQFSLIKNADINQIIAWKNGLFWFKNNTIQEVMRQIARWYDAEVVIRGNIPQHFTGSISRNSDVHRIFKILQETGNIHFKVEENKIIVTP